MPTMINSDIESFLSKIPEDQLIDIFDKSDVIAMVNWTILLNMTSIVEFFCKQFFQIFPKIFFFVLADTEKRERSELIQFLKII